MSGTKSNLPHRPVVFWDIDPWNQDRADRASAWSWWHVMIPILESVRHRETSHTSNQKSWSKDDRRCLWILIDSYRCFRFCDLSLRRRALAGISHIGNSIGRSSTTGCALGLQAASQLPRSNSAGMDTRKIWEAIMWWCMDIDELDSKFGRPNGLPNVLGILKSHFRDLQCLNWW